MDIELWILYSWDESWQVLSLLLVFISASHPNLQYVADFAPELGLIIMETKYLEQLGFQVPELARNVALQVFCQIMSLNSVWNEYTKTFLFLAVFTSDLDKLSMSPTNKPLSKTLSF